MFHKWRAFLPFNHNDRQVLQYLNLNCATNTETDVILVGQSAFLWVPTVVNPLHRQVTLPVLGRLHTRVSQEKRKEACQVI